MVTSKLFFALLLAEGYGWSNSGLIYLFCLCEGLGELDN